MPARSVKNRKKSRKQRGGTKLTDAQVNILSGLGFTDEQKNAFNAIVEQTFNENVTAMLVTAAQNDIHRINPQTGVNFTPQNLIDNLRNTVRNAAGVKRRRKSKKMRKSKKRNNRSYKKSKKQRGGADFSQAQTQQLLDLGFTEANIQTLAQLFLDNMSGDAAMKLIQQSLGQINNITGQPNTPQEIIDSLNPDNNENDLSEIGSENGSDVNNVSVGSFAFENDDLSDIGDDNSQHNISDDSFDFYPDDDLDNNDNNDNNNLNNNISDVSEDSIVLSDQGDTTRDDSRMSIGELDEDEDENGHQNAGRRTRKGRKGKKSRKTKKQRGGTVFSQEQLTELGRLGFNDQQKKILAREFSITPPNMAMESIRQALQHNHITGQPDTVESIMRMFPPEGGKRRKSRKSRKMKGGMRYGTGVGANCFDPNFSIYNTPTLSLFPYKPN